MPSHERCPPASLARRNGLRAGLVLLVAGLPVISTTCAAAPAVALPAPPAAAQAVDWDHFGEPTLSAARRANVAASRALSEGAGQHVEMQLYRLPGDASWEQVLRHYQHGAAPAWKAVATAGRVDTGNPARQQRFNATDDAAQGFAIVWLPPAGDVRDGLLMVLRTVPAR